MNRRLNPSHSNRKLEQFTRADHTSEGISMSNTPDSTIYDLIGEAGFTRLVAAFYAQIPDDDILGPMYPPDDLAGAEKRLRDFLIFRFGGPDRYIQERGHPRLRMRHNPFSITPAGGQRWVELMDKAFAEVALPPEAEAPLREFFIQGANFMVNAR